MSFQGVFVFMSIMAIFVGETDEVFDYRIIRLIFYETQDLRYFMSFDYAGSVRKY